jgi:hypothetical protein
MSINKLLFSFNVAGPRESRLAAGETAAKWIAFERIPGL